VALGASGTSARSRRSAIGQLCASRGHALAIAAVQLGVLASRSAHGHRATMRISARALARLAICKRGPGSKWQNHLLPGPVLVYGVVY